MTVNQETLQGHWNQLKGKIQEKWGQVSQDDLDRVHGNVDELIGIIQQKTGESREAIQGFLQELAASAGSVLGQATETAREYAKQATQKVQDSARKVSDQVCEHTSELKDMVCERPCQSAAVCFGAGVLAGVLLTMLLRSK